MKRDPQALEQVLWDVLVIGGGIHGACVAWDAILRGLTLCLVEKADFGSGTSANTLKIIHGGLRYLQQADYRRMRESIGERRTLLRIAPHLVHPLPIVVPTYGHGRRGRELLHVALLLNDLISLDRNAGLDRAQHIPRGRTVSRRECLRLAPGLDACGVTGGGVFHDAQVENSERLVLAFLRSAAKAGAELANYAEVVGLRHDAGGPFRVSVADRLTGERFLIRARVVVNASGPWVGRVLGLATPAATLGTRFAKAFNVVTRRLFREHAVALPIRGLSGGRRSRGGNRLLFVVPWREHSLLGTWYEPHDGRPGDVSVTEADVARLIAEVSRTCPALALGIEDVRLVHGGLLPVAATEGAAVDTQLLRHGRIVDHAPDGFPGLLSVVGVKLTTARLMAERTVDRVFERLHRTPAPPLSARVPLHGAQGEPLHEQRRRNDGVAAKNVGLQHGVRGDV